MAIDMKAIHDSRRTLVMGVLNITEDSFSCLLYTSDAADE